METPFQEWLARIAAELGARFRAELALFRREATDQGREAGLAVVWMACTAIAAIGATMAFGIFLALILAQAMPAWTAALIVAVVYAVVACGLAVEAKRRFDAAFPITFDRTTTAIKEDVGWVARGMKTH